MVSNLLTFRFIIKIITALQIIIIINIIIIFSDITIIIQILYLYYRLNCICVFVFDIVFVFLSFCILSSPLYPPPGNERVMSEISLGLIKPMMIMTIFLQMTIRMLLMEEEKTNTKRQIHKYKNTKTMSKTNTQIQFGR